MLLEYILVLKILEINSREVLSLVGHIYSHSLKTKSRIEIVKIEGCRPSWRVDTPERKALDQLLIIYPDDNDAVKEEALVVKNSFHGMSLRWMVVS